MLDEVVEHSAGADREFGFTLADFREIAAVIHAEAGIALPESKAPLVYARLVKRLRLLGLRDFATYVTRLRGADAADERLQLVTALTTNVTRFFREPHHLDHLRQTVAASRARQSGKPLRLRLWSAACSTGQEPFSMAAAVADLLGGPAVDAKILATDIDPTALSHAEQGRFDAIDGVPADRKHYFKRDGRHWIANDRLRSLITFRQLNLNAPWPVSGPFDAIFCRNVAIYFDRPTQARLWLSFAQVMKPGAALYIGHSERISGEATTKFENVGITTYLRRSDI